MTTNEITADVTATETTAKSPAPSPAAEIRFEEFVLRNSTLVRAASDAGDGVYIDFRNADGLPRLYSLKSREVMHELRRLYAVFTNGTELAHLSTKDIRYIIEFLEAKAHQRCELRRIGKRVLWLPEQEAILVNLSQLDGRCALVTPDGWSLVVPDPAVFVHYPTHRPLAVPVHSDDGHAAFIKMLPPGITPDNAKLLLGAILACFIPPDFAGSLVYPVITAVGPPGSGKSSVCRFIKRVVDNEVALTAAKPTKTEDLFLVGRTSHLMAFDNLDRLSPSLSDAICQVTADNSVIKRKLYTDTDLNILRTHAPVLLNGTTPILQRADIIDRSINIHLPRIEQYDPDAGSDADILMPVVLGYILDLMSRALANYSRTQLDDPPRLATVATFVQAAEPFGSPTPFAELMVKNQNEALKRADENHPTLDALYELVAAAPARNGYAFNDTYKQLLSKLAVYASPQMIQSADWISTTRDLSLFLTERSHALSLVGINIEPGPRRNNGRLVRISRTEKFVYEESRGTNKPHNLFERGAA